MVVVSLQGVKGGKEEGEKVQMKTGECKGGDAEKDSRGGVQMGTKMKMEV